MDFLHKTGVIFTENPVSNEVCVSYLRGEKITGAKEQ